MHVRRSDESPPSLFKYFSNLVNLLASPLDKAYERIVRIMVRKVPKVEGGRTTVIGGDHRPISVMQDRSTT